MLRSGVPGALQTGQGTQGQTTSQKCLYSNQPLAVTVTPSMSGKTRATSTGDASYAGYMVHTLIYTITACICVSGQQKNPSGGGD